jgi:predicted secreted Zn-dependent protease
MMRLLKIAIAAMALAAASGPVLAVEKCVGPDGKISYLDVCPAGSTRAPATTDEQLIPTPRPGTTILKPQIQPIPEPSPGAPITVKPIPPPPPPPPPPVPPLPAVLAQAPADVTLEYYDIEGSDQASLINALNARGADLSRSSWKLAYQYKPGRELGRCAVGVVTTKLDLAMTLPRWSPPAGTPATLIERWQRYLLSLLAYQNGRLERARELERALKPALEAVPPAADCPALDVAVRERYEALQQEVKARDAEPTDTGKLVFE